MKRFSLAGPGVLSLVLLAVAVYAFNSRPVSNTFDFPEGEVCWVSPPLRPDGGIVNAAALEAAIEADLGADPDVLKLYVARRPNGLSSNYQCYPADAPANFSPAITCTSFTDHLTWDASVREGIAIQVENGGNGVGSFTWSGEEEDPPCYGLGSVGLFIKAIPYDTTATDASELRDQLNLDSGASCVTSVSRFVRSTGLLVTYSGSTPATDFPLVPGEAYGIFTNGSCGSCGTCVDMDGDGFGSPPGFACEGGAELEDCDDANPEIYPGQAEDCGNRIDDNCDGIVDRDDPICPPPGCTTKSLRPANRAFLSGKATPLADGSLFGTVSDSTLHPIEDVLVEVIDPGTGTIVATAISAVDGSYNIAPLPEAVYTVDATPPVGSGFGSVTIPNVAVFGDFPLDIFLVLRPVILSGVVLDRDDLPLAGVELRLRTEGGVLVDSAATAVDGSFLLGAEPGTYHLSLSGGQSEIGPDPAFVTTSWSLTARDVSLASNVVKTIRLPTQRLTYDVEDTAGAPVPNTQLQMLLTSVGFASEDLTFAGSQSGSANVGAAASTTFLLLTTTDDIPLRVYPDAASGLAAIPHDSGPLFADETRTIVIPDPVTLRGTVQDRDGNFLPIESARLGAANQVTIAASFDGSAFVIRAAPREYGLSLSLEIDTPQSDSGLSITRWNLSSSINLTGDTVKAFKLPTLLITYDVEDATGAPVPDTALSINAVVEPFSSDGLDFRGSNVITANVGADATVRMIVLRSLPVDGDAVPPPASGLARISLLEPPWTVDENRTIVLPAPFRLSGQIFDREGFPLPDQRVSLDGGGAGASDAGGFYSAAAAPAPTLCGFTAAWSTWRWSMESPPRSRTGTSSRRIR